MRRVGKACRRSVLACASPVAVLVSCRKPLQGCLLFGAEDLGSSSTFLEAGSLGGFEMAKYVSDSGLPASNLIGDCQEVSSSWPAKIITARCCEVSSCQGIVSCKGVCVLYFRPGIAAFIYYIVRVVLYMEIHVK